MCMEAHTFRSLLLYLSWVTKLRAAALGHMSPNHNPQNEPKIASLSSTPAQ